jgi:putative autotransporter adhesin-like protein
VNPIALLAASHQQMNPRTALLPRVAISVLLAALILPACDWVGKRGNGVITTESRSTADFLAVDASGAYKIVWSAGAPALTVTTDRNLLNHVTTTVTDGKLRIRTNERVRPTHGIRIVISSQTLSGARLRGATDFKGSKIASPSFFLESDGASDVILDGTADSLTARLRGAGDLDAGALQAKVVELSLMGAADAKVYATESLSVSIKGAGDVRYGGNPKTIKKSVAGAGSVRPKK